MICKCCDREMSDPETVSCSGNTHIEYPDGEKIQPIPHSGEKRCGECGVAPGGMHHPGCDLEKCPRCEGQIISCGCLDDEWPVIFVYTREQAIKDGLQVLAEGELAEAVKGYYKYPLYITTPIMGIIDQAEKSERYPDKKYILRHILWTSLSSGKRISAEAVTFKVALFGADSKDMTAHRMVMQVGPMDFNNPTPALTLMTPQEV